MRDKKRVWDPTGYDFMDIFINFSPFMKRRKKAFD
jgi:hypothetical protein